MKQESPIARPRSWNFGSVASRRCLRYPPRHERKPPCSTAPLARCCSIWTARISSIAAAERVWVAWAERHGLDVAAFLPSIHGVRGIDVISQLGLPGVDPEAEVQAVLLAEMPDVGGVDPIEGAAALLASLPPDRWAIVTSSPRKLALRRLEAAGLPPPPVLVTGEEIQHGKPAPDCFLLGAKRLGQKIEDCLVLKDAPAGIQAAEAAGAALIVVTTTHKHPLDTKHPTIAGYGKLTAALLRS